MSSTTVPDREDASSEEWCLFVAAPVQEALVGVHRALARGALVVLGRDDESFAKGVFNDGKISRKHAQLEVDDAGVLRVTDLGSSNGTFVNGARIERVSLAVGDVLRIGAALLVVQKTPAKFYRPRSVLVGVGPALGRMQHELARALGSGQSVALWDEPGAGGARVASEIHRIRAAVQLHEWSMSAWSDRLPRALERALETKDGATIVLTGLPPRRTLARTLITERLRAPRSAHDPLIVVILDATQSYEPELTDGLQSVKIPPLRDRPEDIAAIAIELTRTRSLSLQALSARAWSSLLRAPWPGNVAQLESALHLAHEALSRGEEEQIDKWIRDGLHRQAPQSRAIEAPGTQAEFVFARTGKWFTLSGGERVSLHRKEVLSRVLGALVRERAEHPGRVINSDALIAIAWAGERFIDGSGENRLYVALTNLRQLGLRPILERAEDGYRLDPSVAARVVEE